MSREYQKDKAQSKIWLTINIKGNNKQFYSYTEIINSKDKIGPRGLSQSQSLHLLFKSNQQKTKNTT